VENIHPRHTQPQTPLNIASVTVDHNPIGNLNYHLQIHPTNLKPQRSGPRHPRPNLKVILT